MRRTTKILTSLLLACATLTAEAQESVNTKDNGMKQWSLNLVQPNL